MAHVKIKAALSSDLFFGGQPDLSQVTQNDTGLVWFAPYSPGSVDGVIVQTFGGTLDPQTKAPTGAVSAYAIYLKDGTELLSVDGLHIKPDLLLAGSSDALYAKLFEGGDLVEGGPKADALVGLSGDDTLLGRDLNDTLDGGLGSDLLKGGAGDDLVTYAHSTVGGMINVTTGVATFGADTDKLFSVEQAVGSSFDDLIVGSLRDNAFWGGLGNDTIHAGRGQDTVYGEDGDDLLRGGAGNDEIYGGRGSDYIGADAGDDLLSGGAGADSLYGGDGHDSLLGGAGNDVLSGGAGADTLNGGTGRNGLDGGSGDDTFHFAKASDYVTTGSGHDTLVFTGASQASVQVGDFDVVRDMIALDVANPDATSVEQLMETGKLTVTGGEGFTLVTFGKDQVVLTGTDFADFSNSNFELI